MRILVTDGHTRAALAVTRSLGARGHTVHVSAPGPRSLAGCSRYCAAEHLQASEAEGPDALGGSLARLARDIEPQIVLGVTDASLTVLHARREELRPAALPPPSAELYALASDKTRLFDTAREAGIPVSPGIVVAGGSVPGATELEPLGTPLVVRPAFSWREDDGKWVRGGVSYEDGREALRARVERDPALRFSYLVQRHVDGEGCGLFVIAREGRVVRFFAHRRLREKPPSGGVSTLCESVAPPRDLLAAARTWCERVGWTGLAMLEFKRDLRDRAAYLIEVNARPWGSMALAAAAGVDFPADLIHVATSGNAAPAGSMYREGVRLRWWWGDVDHFYLRERERGRGRLGALAAGLRRAIASGPWPEVWDTFRRDDPLPFARETVQWVRA